MTIKHTLKAAIDAGATSIRVYCKDCINSKPFSPDHALELWGTDATFPEIARRSKCKRCKQQATSAAPIWPTLSNCAGRARENIPEGWEDVSYDNPNRPPGRD